MLEPWSAASKAKNAASSTTAFLRASSPPAEIARRARSCDPVAAWGTCTFCKQRETCISCRAVVSPSLSMPYAASSAPPTEAPRPFPAAMHASRATPEQNTSRSVSGLHAALVECRRKHPMRDSSCHGRHGLSVGNACKGRHVSTCVECHYVRDASFPSSAYCALNCQLVANACVETYDAPTQARNLPNVWYSRADLGFHKLPPSAGHPGLSRPQSNERAGRSESACARPRGGSLRGEGLSCPPHTLRA